MKKILPLLSLLLLASCGKTVFSESHTIAETNWKYPEPQEFDFNIRNLDDYYDIYMTITLDTARFPGREFPLVCYLTSPEGEMRMFDAHIQLFEPKSGKRTGTLNGPQQTATAKVRKYLTFNRAGQFHLRVLQGTHKYDQYGVHSFGVKVEKAEMELPK